MRREEKRRGWMEAAHGGKDWAKEGRRWGRGGVVPSTCMGVKPPAPHLISPGLGQTALLISADSSKSSAYRGKGEFSLRAGTLTSGPSAVLRAQGQEKAGRGVLVPLPFP